MFSRRYFRFRTTFIYYLTNARLLYPPPNDMIVRYLGWNLPATCQYNWLAVEYKLCIFSNDKIYSTKLLTIINQNVPIGLRGLQGSFFKKYF